MNNNVYTYFVLIKTYLHKTNEFMCRKYLFMCLSIFILYYIILVKEGN